MIRSVLIGLDGSACSTGALELGIRWAARHAARVVGLGVIDEPAIRNPGKGLVGNILFKKYFAPLQLAAARDRVGRALERFANRCAEAGVPHTSVEEVGTPAEQIVREGQRHNLILLGRRTHFRFATQNDPCDTLYRVLGSAACPVVGVPERLGGGTAVVVAYDGTPHADRVVRAFQASGLAGPGEVRVVGVGADRGEMARHAGRAADFLSSHAIRATPHVLTPPPSAPDAVLHQARVLDAELLVMGCYGRLTWRERLLGSVTHAALQETAVPLFLYR